MFRIFSFYRCFSSQFTPTIGLEIHVQLLTNSKLFSDAPIFDGMSSGSNRTVALLDMGTPGILPTMNEQSVKLALKASVILNCNVATECRFDRKHYFYPDMPTGYQITQNELPIAQKGYFDYYIRDSRRDTKRASIKQIQLEMDSGKLIHNEDCDLVDMNRSGIGLVEIVTEPCFQTPVEASTFVENLRWTLADNGISHCQMHRGQLRVDANVSVASQGSKGSIVEIKNINSFVDIEQALEYEIKRQILVLSEGGTVETETRGIVDGKTVSSRAKGEDHDYRFLPEPNIPRIQIDPEWLAEIKSEIKQGSHVYYIKNVGLSVNFAFEILYDESLRSFVDAMLTHIQNEAFKYEPLLREFPKILVDCGSAFPPPSGIIPLFAILMEYFITEKITRLTFIDLIKFYLNGSKIPIEEKINQDRLWRIRDKELVNGLISDVLQRTKPDIIHNARAGRTKSFNRLRNQVIVNSQKRIAIDEIKMALKERLETFKE